LTSPEAKKCDDRNKAIAESPGVNCACRKDAMQVALQPVFTQGFRKMVEKNSGLRLWCSFTGIRKSLKYRGNNKVTPSAP